MRDSFAAWSQCSPDLQSRANQKKWKSHDMLGGMARGDPGATDDREEKGSFYSSSSKIRRKKRKVMEILIIK